MLFLYCDIASWIDEKKYCYPSLTYFKNDLDTTSDNRIIQALTELKLIDVIDYSNVGHVIDKRKQVTRGNNIYTLCCIKDYADILEEAIQNRKGQLLKENKKIAPEKKIDNNNDGIDKVQNNTKDISAIDKKDSDTNNISPVPERDSEVATVGSGIYQDFQPNNVEFLEKLAQFRNQNNEDYIETVSEDTNPVPIDVSAN